MAARTSGEETGRDDRGLRRRLLRWYDREKRDLPWRRTRDPYHVWVSEIMLQQTRVESVIPYYDRFLARFPDVHQLADADESEVLALWSGLGYYRRARMLRAAAQVVKDRHDGRFPQDEKEARALPGIGRYTAGAILSIAYDRRLPVLDGNVERVLCRLESFTADPRRAPLQGRLWERATELADGPRPGDWNQALMELGATICTPAASARCERCPVRVHCGAFAAGNVVELPALAARKELREETWGVLLLERRGRLLAWTREGPLLGGMIELPSFAFEGPAGAGFADRLRELGRDALGAQLGELEHRLRLKQAISGRQIQFEVYAAPIEGRIGSRRAKWYRPEELRSAAITTATRRIVQTLGASSERSARAATVTARRRSS